MTILKNKSGLIIQGGSNIFVHQIMSCVMPMGYGDIKFPETKLVYGIIWLYVLTYMYFPVE